MWTTITFFSTPPISCLFGYAVFEQCVCVWKWNGVNAPGVCLIVNPGLFMSLSEHWWWHMPLIIGQDTAWPLISLSSCPSICVCFHPQVHFVPLIFLFLISRSCLIHSLFLLVYLYFNLLTNSSSCSVWLIRSVIC